MSKRVLVTGSSGFLGSSLVNKLSNKLSGTSAPFFYSVLAASRTCLPISLPNVEQVPLGDLSSGFPDPELCRSLADVDVIVHTAARVHTNEPFSHAFSAYEEYRATNVDATFSLALNAADAGVRRFIYISSIGVHGQSTFPGQPLVETSPTNPYNSYTRSKLEAEKKLFAVSKHTGLEVVVIRPPLIYGPSAPGNFRTLLRAINAGLPLPLGALANKRSFVFLGNLLDFIVNCASHPSAANNIFLVSDGNDLTLPELIHLISDVQQKTSSLFSVPPSILKVIAYSSGQAALYRKLCCSLQIDISKSHQLLAWHPPYSVPAAIKSSLLDTSLID